VRELEEFRVDYTQSGHMTVNARSGQHVDLLLALAIAAWRAKLGQSPPLLSFYRTEMEMAKKRDQDYRAEASPLDTRAEQSPVWTGTRKQVQDDARELQELYWNIVNGLQHTDLCPSCGKELGLTKVSDGINRWHPDCPVPVTH